jgi:hypothetical protein
VIYIRGLGYSPSAGIYNIRKTKSILSGNSSVDFNVDVILLGA